VEVLRQNFETITLSYNRKPSILFVLDHGPHEKRRK
jgi:hypothetical protein